MTQTVDLPGQKTVVSGGSSQKTIALQDLPEQKVVFTDNLLKRKSFVPGRALCLFIAALIIPLIFVAWYPDIAYIVLILDILAVLIAILQWQKIKKGQITLIHNDNNQFSVHKESLWTWQVELTGTTPVQVEFMQNWPETIQGHEQILSVILQPGEIAEVSFSFTPHERGNFKIAYPTVTMRSTWLDFGRCGLEIDDNATADLVVIPDLSHLALYDRLQRSRSLQQLGIHRQRQIGSGREFEQLREYQPDDAFRDINWKATARHAKPITNVWQAERGQDVILCLDAGRLMTFGASHSSIFDQAVDAALLVAHAANHQGDRVGLAVFQDEVKTFLPPQTGRAALQQIVSQLATEQPAGVYPSYAALWDTLSRRQKRRSLIFFFTDLGDVQITADIAKVAALIAKRHIVVIASLREPYWSETTEAAPRTKNGCYKIVAARELLSIRAKRLHELYRRGVEVLEADDGKLSMQSVNLYLSVKYRQRI